MSVNTIVVATVVLAIVVSVVMSVRSAKPTSDKRTADKASDSVRTVSGVRTDKRTRGHGSDRARTLAMYVAVLAGVFTTLLTIAAFVLSYAHLENVAVANGVPSGFLAWMWPGTIDTFIVVGELLILFAAILGLGFAWWGWGLTVGGSMTSIAFNVAGVGGDARVMEYAVAAAPPVAALFAFGALMHQVRQYVATYVDVSAPDTVRTPDIVSVPVRPIGEADVSVRTPDKPVSAPLSAPVRPVVAPVRPDTAAVVRPDTVRTSDKPASKVSVRTLSGPDTGRTDKVSAVVSALSVRPDMTGTDVAGMFGVSGRTGQRLLADARKLVAA